MNYSFDLNLLLQYDSAVLHDFSKLVLGSASNSRSLQVFDFSRDSEDVIRDDIYNQLDSSIKMSESFRSLLFDISSKLLSHVSDNSEDNVPLPALCSPDFDQFMALVRSFLRAHKVLI